MHRLPAVLSTLIVGVALSAGTAAAAPSSVYSDEVHAPNTGTSCSGQATTSGIPYRSIIDTLDDSWRATATGLGSPLIIQGDLPAVAINTNPLSAPLTFAGSPLTATISRRDLTAAQSLSNAPNSIGAASVATGTNPGTFTSDKLQDCAPRPQSLYPGTGGGLPRLYNAVGFTTGGSTSLDGVLVEFSQPVRNFGAWFGDLETRFDPDPNDALQEGLPARMKLFDAAGNVLLNEPVPSDFRLQPDGTDPDAVPDADTDPDRIAIDQSLCGGPTPSDYHLGCGNQATRWIGFTGADAQVAKMLIVVGDDDDSNDGKHQHHRRDRVHLIHRGNRRRGARRPRNHQTCRPPDCDRRRNDHLHTRGQQSQATGRRATYRSSTWCLRASQASPPAMVVSSRQAA